MREESRPAPLRANPRTGKQPFLPGQITLAVWWALIIAGTGSLILVTTGLDRSLPGAGTPLSLGLRWAIGLAYAGQAWLTWRISEFSRGWRLGFTVIAVLFLVRAALATYVALR